MQPSSERFTPFDGWAYSLLLGFYLGDGCISSTGSSYQLRVILDGLYPDVIDTCAMAITMSLVDPVNVNVRPKKTDRGVLVEASYKRWPEVFPQHGPGRKHDRPIVLAEWQRAIVDRWPHVPPWFVVTRTGHPRCGVPAARGRVGARVRVWARQP